MSYQSDSFVKCQNESFVKWAKSIEYECDLLLKRVNYARDFNPAVAVVGEVQVGKSFLVNNLLTTSKSSLRIYDGKTPDGYGFIEKINPIGGGRSATGLISRFTINRYSDNPEFPICAVMLTPVDIVLILCDAYYNYVQKQLFPEMEQIVEKVKWIKEHYYGKAKVQDYIKEVDILEIKDYLENTQFLEGEAFISNLHDACFFETVSECIGSIDIYEWRSVFGFLWNHEPHLSDLFYRLISALQTLGFARKCYIKIDPLLRKEGTILQVDRLYELLNLKEMHSNGKVVTVDEARTKDMEVWNGEKTVTVLKSEFCALTTEVIFTIVENDNLELLREKPFLEYMDVLDFPGENTRLKYYADEITKIETVGMLHTGKLAYLINKYSKQYLISNLMFCHHDIKSEVTTLSGLLKGWIHSAVGETPEKRAKFINASEISPLFIVGTKFNSDLVRHPIESFGCEEEKMQAKKARWMKRFNSTLGDLIRESNDDPWFSQWTPGKPFQNIYLVRNFRYSCQSGVYVGYQKKDEKGNWVDNYVDGVCREESISEDYQKFIPELKRTFLENDFVQAHFENPEKSWDEAVSLNHDGTAWLIENLTKAAVVAKGLREKKLDWLYKNAPVIDSKMSQLYDDMFQLMEIL